ncbi:hypothetical protein CBR_g34335 [Chara braunii]|uniref:Uncharacterized protein n=1 Tax=Chara braunii TaxID=69332 RepID=A0A388LIB0_CHABU|nr:hypothetical protein CBR_g34335 [Chara braunii]|eukprot:GBG82056.1 hypothetical protein CBR_g34335 [Chara braunii]
MAFRNVCHFCQLPGHFTWECPFRFQPNGAEMSARIRDGGAPAPGRGDSNGLLPPRAQGASTSNAIVPYQQAQNRSYSGGSGNYNSGGYNGGHYSRGGGYNEGQRYSRQWSGGYNNRDREKDCVDKIDRMYNLRSDQVEEREQKKQENAKLELLEEEKKKLQAEEERRQQANKEKEQQEARLGRIVRTNDDNEVDKLRKELEELRARSLGTSTESRVEALRKEKEALLKKKDQETEERLRNEIAELKSRRDLETPGEGKQDELLTLKLQVKERSSFRTAMEEKNAKLSALKKENGHLKRDFSELGEEFVVLRSKRDAGAVNEKSPPEEPARGKQRADPSTAMYTPKDLEALQKAYKVALAGKEMALKEADMLKDRMAKMVAKMAAFRDNRLKELRQLKKHEMEEICADEGITYIKLDQAKADVAEIRASHDYAEWLKEKEVGEKEDQDLHHATSAEDVDEA